MTDKATRFAEAVRLKVRRRQHAEKTGARLGWSGFSMFGVIGWSVAAPAIVGALLGKWIDQHHPSSLSWTLALLVAGLLLGCANAWYWVSAQSAAISDDTADHD